MAHIVHITIQTTINPCPNTKMLIRKATFAFYYLIQVGFVESLVGNCLAQNNVKSLRVNVAVRSECVPKTVTIFSWVSAVTVVRKN